MKNVKKRLVSMLCIMSVLCSACFNMGIVLAEGNGNQNITLNTAPEKDFKNWTFSDLGINDQELTGHLNWGDDFKEQTIGTSLDKTIFSGKIKFAGGTTNFGNFYLGGASQSDGSKWRGFVFTASGAENLKFAFVGPSGERYNANGNVGDADTDANAIAVFDKTVAGTTLRGNANLQVSISVEYVSKTETTATLKMGVFFDGRLYNNTYYTVKDVPLHYLNQNVRFYKVSDGNAIASHKLQQSITLETAPEKDFANWTFSDLGIEDQELTGHLNWGDDFKDQTIGTSLNKTIFSGKINFAGGTSNFGNFYLGGASQSDGSKWRGFVFTASGTDNLKFAFVGQNGERYNANGNVGDADTDANAIAVFDKTVAGTTLRGNANLQVAISVEYVSTTETTTTLKLGVFFDGKLYNNTYYTVKDVPLHYLNQNIRYYMVTAGSAIASERLEGSVSEDITLETAPEKDFANWTFSDLGIEDQTLTASLNWDKDWGSQTLGNSLDKTLFSGRIKFAAETSKCGNFYLGAAGNGDNSNWRGFVFTASGTDNLKFAFVGPSGNRYNVNGNVGDADTDANAIAIFDKNVAKTTLRGNADLRVAVSVEYVETTETAATLKVGVFFDGKLYNNAYYTVKDVPLAYLNQSVRFYVAGEGNAIASVHLEGSVSEDITLETAPEKDFACWTFEDLFIDDQELREHLNWDKNWSKQTLGASLDKTLFNGKVKFAAESANCGNFYIGGAGNADNSNWRGFVFTASGAENLKFAFVGPNGERYNANGNVGDADTNANAIAVFNKNVAGTTLRGNDNLRVSVSVEYVEQTETTATLKVGVFFDGKLYNSEYYTVKDVPLSYLNQSIRFYVPGQGNAIASQHMETCTHEVITLETAPEKDFACWTFSDLDIDDHTLYGHINWGANFTEQTIGNSLDKTIFNGKINFAADTKNFGNFYLGGAAKNDNSKWRGFVFIAGNTTDCLKFGFQGTDGRFYNALGDTGSAADSNANVIEVFEPGIAGTTLRGNKDLQVSVSVEYVEKTATTATLKVGVFFDGMLYGNRYYTVKEVPLEYLNQNIRFYTQGEKNAVASQHLCGKGTGQDSIVANSVYRELTMKDFSILDTKVESITGNDFRVENFYDRASLNGTAVSVICNFPSGGQGRFSLGGSFWRGVYFGSTKDGKIEVGYVNTAGDAQVITRMNAETAGVDAIVGKEVNLRVTFDITDKGHGKSDMRMGIYVNGKLYDGTYYTLRNVDTATMTRTMKLYVTSVPLEIKSAPITIDLAEFGFDNKTWKEKI